MTEEVVWHKVAAVDQLEDGRVATVIAGHKTIALTRCNGRYGALDNRCPHQGGPLGEGSIEKGWLRCPWHGYDYSPVDGTPPPGFKDAPASFAVEERVDGVYVALPPERPRDRTVSDVVVDTLVAWGVRHVFGMVGHSNLGFADAMRVAEQRGDLTFIGIRHEGAAAFAASAYGKLTGRPAACFAIAGPGSTNLLTGLYDAKVDRAPVLAISGQVPSKVRGRGAFQDLDLTGAFTNEGFKLRDGHWAGEIKPSERALIAVNLYAGNQYWFSASAANTKAKKIAVDLYDETGKPVTTEVYNEGEKASAGFSPTASGQYFVAVSLLEGEATTFCLVYSYK